VGDRGVGEITKLDVVELLDNIADTVGRRGAKKGTTADRTLAAIRQPIDDALATGGE
jgi:hypothetical protein